MKKLYDEIKNTYKMSTDKETQKQFKDEMVRKTWEYQKKFGFKTNPREGHEFWNVEADAFKHAFGSAKMALEMGELGSLIGDIHHESITPNNPYGEWNMDSWNNNQGREIADEIKKEYGRNFERLSDKEKDAIIATKVMIKMQSGELITQPSDSRRYDGFLENLFRGNVTGQAAPVESTFTPEQIGKMSADEFIKNEKTIMEQLRDGKIKSEVPKIDYEGFKNPETGEYKVYTREDIAKMSSKEYSQKEKQIMAQMNRIGIPYKKDLPDNILTDSNTKNKGSSSGSKPKGSTQSSGEGKWVTINGNHVLIEK